MAVSNSTDFTLTMAQVIEEARSLLGVHADEEPIEAHELERAKRALNLMLKGWQADGVMCWTMTEGTLSLVEGQASYAFGAGGAFTTVPMEIIDIRINRSGNDLLMYRMSREEYFALPNKASKGYPTQFYYDRQRSGGTLYVWPAPDAQTGTLKFTYRRIIMDVDGANDNFDAPQEWLKAITYGLARELSPRYGKGSDPDIQLVIAEAERSYSIVKNFDTGEGKGSLSVLPDFWSGYARG